MNGFKSIINQTSKYKGDITEIRTQITFSNNNSRPDLIGYDSNHKLGLIVENKFEANLTPQQKNEYCNMFDVENGLFLYIVLPSNIDKYWKELTSNFKTKSINIIDANFWEAKLSNCSSDAKAKNITLAITTWQYILGSIRNVIDPTKEEQIMSDTKQLIGLCDDMNTRDFIPFEENALDTTIPDRVLDICNIIEDVSEQLDSEQKSIQIKKYGLKTINGRGIYGKKMVINTVNGCSLLLDMDSWLCSKIKTPIWLKVQKRSQRGSWENTNSEEQKDIILSICKDALIKKDGVYIPLFLKKEVEYKMVIDDIKKQVIFYSEKLPKLATKNKTKARR